VILILVTGDRNWRNHEVIYDVLEWYASYATSVGEKITVVEGEAEGADKIAAWAARDLAAHYPVVVDPHPAQWERIHPKSGKKYFFRGAGPERNNEMLDLVRRRSNERSIVLSFHNDLAKSRGTRHCTLGAIKRQLVTLLVAECSEAGCGYTTELIEPQLGNPEEILKQALQRLRPLE
jgi:hypothetical protein